MKLAINKLWLYSLIGVLNFAVGVMFYVINIKPATVVAFSDFNHSLPVKPQLIPAKVGIPTRIVIPSLAIDLGVGVGAYNAADGTWNVDTTRAYYADTSMPINNSNGNTLIYGHAQAPVFGRLPTIQPNAETTVYTDTGYVFRYAYQSMTEVLPTDTSVFKSSGSPTLVLQTCIGDWDTYRALFSFKLESVEKV